MCVYKTYFFGSVWFLLDFYVYISACFIYVLWLSIRFHTEFFFRTQNIFLLRCGKIIINFSRLALTNRTSLHSGYGLRMRVYAVFLFMLHANCFAFDFYL